MGWQDGHGVMITGQFTSKMFLPQLLNLEASSFLRNGINRGAVVLGKESQSRRCTRKVTE
jgi:hypothetical protein